MTFEQLNQLPVWQQMPTITLDEMSSIKLMNRVDTKYVMSLQTCMELLRRAVNDYSVQIIGDVRACRYSTLYYDTEDLEMYTVHHNQKLTRQKVRSRTYVESGITFIEIKNKTNRGRTKKKRIQIPQEVFYTVTSYPESREFLSERANYAVERLAPALTTEFERITLVNHAHTERLTIDLNLRFTNKRIEGAEPTGIDDLVIVELKQDGLCYSPMKQILLDLRVQQFKISKYCLGTVLSNDTVKANRFKRKIRMIRKIINKQQQNL